MEEADAPRVRVPGVRVQMSPLIGDTESARLRVPANPSTLATVRAGVPAAPAVRVMLEGLAVTLKSWTVKIIVVECDRDPVDPSTVTVYTPAVPLQERLDVPGCPSVTVLTDSVHVKPAAGLAVVLRLTLPASPFTGETVMVDVPEVPALPATFVGLPERLKS